MKVFLMLKYKKFGVYHCQPWQNKWKKRKHISVWDAMIVASFRYPYCRRTFSIVNIDNNLINMGQIPLLLQNYVQHDYSQISRWMINNNENTINSQIKESTVFDSCVLPTLSFTNHFDPIRISTCARANSIYASRSRSWKKDWDLQHIICVLLRHLMMIGTSMYLHLLEEL